MMEIGPFRMDPNNPGSLMLLDWGGWEEFAGVVFGESTPLHNLIPSSRTGLVDIES